MHGNKKLTGALSTVTAAVVGIILNLAVWFGVHVLLPESMRGRGIDTVASTITLITFAGMWWLKWNIMVIVFGAGASGVVFQMLF
jgi:chromate transporter